jgi:ubiquinol oxidase
LISQRTAHRIVGYFEEEAVISYTEYLNELEAGSIADQPAPEIAINYWNLPLHSTLKDVVKVIRDDEAGHRDVNHTFADLINLKKNKKFLNSKIETNKEIKEGSEKISS